jgi:hypothetical protein
MDIKQRLAEVVEHQGLNVYDAEQAVALARDALLYMKSLEDANARLHAIRLAQISDPLKCPFCGITRKRK